jgi:hypothetical protein
MRGSVACAPRQPMRCRTGAGPRLGDLRDGGAASHGGPSRVSGRPQSSRRRAARMVGHPGSDRSGDRRARNRDRRRCGCRARGGRPARHRNVRAARRPCARQRARAAPPQQLSPHRRGLRHEPVRAARAGGVQSAAGRDGHRAARRHSACRGHGCISTGNTIPGPPGRWGISPPWRTHPRTRARPYWTRCTAFGAELSQPPPAAARRIAGRAAGSPRSRAPDPPHRSPATCGA